MKKYVNIIAIIKNKFSRILVIHLLDISFHNLSKSVSSKQLFFFFYELF